MGAVYYVEMTLKVKDAFTAANMLRDKISNDEINGFADYNLIHAAENGLYLTSLENILSIILADDSGTCAVKNPDGSISISNDFNASYGWEGILIDIFKRISTYLEDGSEMYIFPDSDYDHLIIQNGRAIQIN